MPDEIVKPEVGRPTKKTEDIVKKLEDMFRLGVKDNAACAYAGISRETFYTWIQDDKTFSDRIESAKNYAVIAARQIVVSTMVDKNTEQDKKVELAKWYLEKHELKNEFGVQQNTQVNVFTALKEKYTIPDDAELPEIKVETNGET